jgi:hypothetical protein
MNLYYPIDEDRSHLFVYILLFLHVLRRRQMVFFRNQEEPCNFFCVFRYRLGIT